MSRRFRVDTTALVALSAALICLVVRAIHIGDPPINHDEPYTLFQAYKAWGPFFDRFTQENNPPLHFILAKLVVSLGGGLTAVRAISLVAASVSAALLVFIGRRLGSIWIGIGAVMLFLFSKLHAYHAHEARPYALAFLLGSALLLAYLRWIERPSHARATLTALLAALLCYTHFFGLWFVLALASGHFLFFRQKLTIKQVLVACGLFLLLLLPYLPIVLSRYQAAAGGSWQNQPTGLISFHYLLWAFLNKPLVVIVSYALFALAVLKWLWRKRPATKPIFLLIWLTVLPPVSMFLLSYTSPCFKARYLIYVSGGVFLLLAAAAWYLGQFLPKAKWSLLLIPIALAAATTELDPRPHGGFQEISDQLKAKRDPGSPVLIVPGNQDHTFMLGVMYEYDREAFEDPSTLYERMKRSGLYLVKSPKKGLILLDSLSDASEIWYVDGWDVWVDPERQVFTRLQQTYPIETMHTGGLTRFTRD